MGAESTALDNPATCGGVPALDDDCVPYRAVRYGNAFSQRIVHKSTTRQVGSTNPYRNVCTAHV